MKLVILLTTNKFEEQSSFYLHKDLQFFLFRMINRVFYEREVFMKVEDSDISEEEYIKFVLPYIINFNDYMIRYIIVQKQIQRIFFFLT